MKKARNPRIVERWEKHEEPDGYDRDHLFERMALLLGEAVKRVGLANAEGNPVLSAWANEARATLERLEEEK